MFIDVHVHARKVPGFPRGGGQAYATPEQLIERYDSLNIEKGVLLPGVSPECSYVPQSNEEVIGICEETGRFIPFCNVDPRALSNSPFAPLGDILKYYRDRGCKGVGEVTANLSFIHPMAENFFRGAESAGMPVTFHVAPRLGGAYGLYDEPGLPGLEFSLQMFPRLNFFGHSQAFWAEIAGLRTPGERGGYPSSPVEEEGAVPRLMRKYPNLYGDLSAGSGHNALNRDREYGVKFLNEFQDRLMFGTDICAPDTPAPLVDLLIELKNEGKISKEMFDKIARGNAVKLLGLN